MQTRKLTEEFFSVFERLNPAAYFDIQSKVWGQREHGARKANANPSNEKLANISQLCRNAAEAKTLCFLSCLHTVVAPSLENPRYKVGGPTCIFDDRSPSEPQFRGSEKVKPLGLPTKEVVSSLATQDLSCGISDELLACTGFSPIRAKLTEIHCFFDFGLAQTQTRGALDEAQGGPKQTNNPRPFLSSR